MPVIWFSLMKEITASRSLSSTRHLIISYMELVLARRLRMSASSRSRIWARLEAINSLVGSG